MWRNSPTPSSTFSYSYNSSSGRSTSKSPDSSYRYDERTTSPLGTFYQDDHHDLDIGDRVIVRSSVGDAKTGILQYVGNVDFAEGELQNKS